MSQNINILLTIQGILSEALRVDMSKVTPNARILTDLCAESLDLLDIRFRIEEEFKFKIPQREIIEHLGKELTRKEISEQFTVQSLVDYVQKRLNKIPIYSQ